MALELHPNLKYPSSFLLKGKFFLGSQSVRLTLAGVVKGELTIANTLVQVALGQKWPF